MDKGAWSATVHEVTRVGHDLVTNPRAEKLKEKEERKDIHLNAEFQTIARRDKKAFLSDQ